MGASAVIGLLFLAVGQTFAQVGTTVTPAPEIATESPLLSGPTSRSGFSGQSPFLGRMGLMGLSQPQGMGGGSGMMMMDPRMSGGMMGGAGFGGQGMMGGDPRMSGAMMGGFGGQGMMADPRMSGGGFGGMADPRMSGGMMADPRMQAGMMADPRMTGMMGGAGGFGGLSPAMYRGQMSSQNPFQRAGRPMMEQPSQFGGQMSPDGMMSPYGGGPNELSGQMGGPGFGSPMGLQSFGGGSGGGDDVQIITAGNGMSGGYPPMGGAGGVSFFPLARPFVRPGSGLTIVSSDSDPSPSERNPYDLSAFLSNPNPFDISAVVSNDTANDFVNGTFGDVVAGKTTTRAAAAVKVETTTPSVVVVGTPVNGTTTQTPCKNPVYMNRVFMSTALAMGLISNNTSCVVLLDH